jgi:arylsulfatase A
MAGMFLSICRLAFLLSFLVALIHVEAASRPNIIYFMADDLGLGDVKCFGGERCQIETPNFDRLAAEGMRFTDAHAVASVCVPSRMAIMTGRYPWRFGPPKAGGPWGFLGLRLPPETFTLGDLMKQAGYSTGYVGKWHLGTTMTTTDGQVQGLENVDYRKGLKTGSADYGFDYSFVLPGSLDMYPYVFVRDNHFVGSVTKQRGWSAFNRVGPTEETFEDFKVLDTFSNEVESYIDRKARAAKEGNPFFLYFALTAPHTPTSPHPKWKGKSSLGQYGDFVMEVDDCLGRAMRALEKHGLAENTLIIATSDHGAASYAGNTEKATFAQYRSMQALGHYSSGIYRGFKFSVYEGGRRVPFIARWPGVIRPGSHCESLIGLQDVFATFADVSGQSLESDQGVDSMSLEPLFRDARSKRGRSTMIQSSVRSWAVRDGKWKLCLCPGSGCVGNYGNIPTQELAYRAALAEFGSVPKREDLLRAPFVQLFDLANDPTESVNIASKHPERVRAIIRMFDDQIAAGRSTPGPRQDNDREGLNYLAGAPKFVLEK